MDDGSVPPPSAFTREERALVARLASPVLVQRHLTALPYNPGDTARSFRGVVRANAAHCLEGALFAATVLERRGYPPLLLDLESQDDLDHVVFLYRASNGRFGAVGASQFPGLHGRKPVYTSVRQLALSYYDPYVDHTGRLKAFGVLDLRSVRADWRLAEDDVWEVFNRLCDMPHEPIPSSDRRYRELRARYQRFKARHPDAEPTYYRTVPNWLQ